MNRGEPQRGFVLVIALLFGVLCALLALSGFNGAQLDAGIATRTIAQRRADLAATGLLRALQEDQRMRPNRRCAGPPESTVCTPGVGCRADFPTVAALVEQLPPGLQAEVILERVSTSQTPRLDEALASGQTLYVTLACEGRVYVSGAGVAKIAALFDTVYPRSATSSAVP